MEEFRDITGYEGLYQVSNLGRVKSLKYCKERIMKTIEDSKGYFNVSLSKKGKKKKYSVHRLVAESFIPNPNNYPCVNHKDENPSNNCVNNLEWCTYKYNSNYGTCIQRRVANTDYKAIAAKIDYKEVSRKRVANTDYKKKVANTDYKEISRKRTEKLSKPVLQYTKDGEFVKEWLSTMECARNGFKQSHVGDCCRGERKTHKGFIWKYKND